MGVRASPARAGRRPSIRAWTNGYIYTAMLGMYFGTALVSGELHGLLAFAIVGFAYARKIPLEEAVVSVV